MNGARYVVLGVARPRAAWFAEVSQWANAAAIPAEFVKCVGVDEVRARIDGGRVFSAVLVDGGLPGVDRDLLATARDAGIAVIVVSDASMAAGWHALGANAVLTGTFGPPELLDALAGCAQLVSTADPLPALDPVAVGRSPLRGRVVAVVGTGGTGTSTVAMAAAQGLAARGLAAQGLAAQGLAEHGLAAQGRRAPGLPAQGRAARRAASGTPPSLVGSTAPPSIDRRGEALPAGGTGVVLADLCLRAEQAMLHDTQAVAPGLQELVEIHRSRQASDDEVRALCFAVHGRAYDLLVGLRRRRLWPTLRPTAVAAAFASLCRAYPIVVVDTDADLEGEESSGSIDVEERNVLARTVVREADVVLAVGQASLKGLHSLTRLMQELRDFGVRDELVQPVINHAPGSARARAGYGRALAELLGASAGGVAVPPAFVPVRNIDAAVRAAAALPSAVVDPVASSLRLHLARPAPLPAPAPGWRRLAPGFLHGGASEGGR